MKHKQQRAKSVTVKSRIDHLPARVHVRDSVLAARLKADPVTTPLIAADAVIVAYVEMTVAIAALEHRIEQLHDTITAALGARAPRSARRR